MATYKQKSILIKTVGFIGDILFASSIAYNIKNKGTDFIRTHNVDYLISVPQPYELLCNNPYIRKVYLPGEVVDFDSYDEIHELKPIHRNETPTIQFQQQCGLIEHHLDNSFYVFTNSSLDSYVSYMFQSIKPKTIVAYLENWEERSFLFTEEEYIRGIDVPNLGYGGKHRDINYIISELSKRDDIYLIPVGRQPGDNHIDLSTISEYSLTASILKNCDWFIGAEGGLCNLAAGVGTKTIITGDFVHQLYGWNGVIEKCVEPKLGPKYYFPTFGHITLDPYFTDEEVVNQINKIIC